MGTGRFAVAPSEIPDSQPCNPLREAQSHCATQLNVA